MREGRTHLQRSAALLAVCAALLWTGPASAQNGVLMQYFHWYNTPSDDLWLKVADQAGELSAAGITVLWLPPAYKGQNGSDTGYGVYDLYDLGEFNQKGSVRTKYGTKAQYLAAIQAAHANGLLIYGDVVLNHRGGADAVEWVESTRVQTFDRNQEYGGNVSIQAWTGFQFPGRGNTYSSFKWKWFHFDGVDWAQNLQENGKIYKFRGTGKAWDTEVDTEYGNYDYLMYADLDFAHADAPLHLNFYNASRGGGNYDMRTLMNGTLMKDQPAKAVTLVENHDTQALQALESPVDNGFKPLAYAFILLREEGLPSVFYADYYGASYTDRGITVNMPSFRTAIDKLLDARKSRSTAARSRSGCRTRSPPTRYRSISPATTATR